MSTTKIESTSNGGGRSTGYTASDNFNMQKFGGMWGRVVKIGLFNNQTSTDGDDNQKYECTFSDGAGIELDGKDFDISFDFEYSPSSGSDSGYSEANITLKNLNDDTQWAIKRWCGISITAGYEGNGNSGVVYYGTIKNVMDKYDTDGSVTLEITAQMLYNFGSVIVQTDTYPIGTPFSDIINDAASKCGIPVNRCDLTDPEFVTVAESPVTGTVQQIVEKYVNEANAIAVKNGKIKDSEIKNLKCYVYAYDANYLEIIDNTDESFGASAMEFDANNGLISVNREDFLADDGNEGVTISAKIMFNWRIRAMAYISIVSKRQPHLNGVYLVYKYHMRGSSRDGDHTVEMDLMPIQGSTASIENLTNMYSLNYTQGPEEQKGTEN